MFECEPSLADPHVPWSYNRLTFDTQHETDRVICEIDPGYETLTVNWSRNGMVLVSLDLNWVSGLETELNRASETLVAHFRDPHILPLRLQLKPAVSVSWGTDAQPA